MNRSLILLLAMAGCMAQPAPEKPERAEVPQVCPPVPAPPKPLAALVSTEQLREWADATEAARKETVMALKICSRRLRMVTEHAP